MAEHDLTLPWHNDDPYPDVIVDSNGVEVASCDCNEDCDFIVKAVNNHGALVEAMEICKGCLEACADMHPDNAGIARALSAARATLAVVGSPKP